MKSVCLLLTLPAIAIASAAAAEPVLHDYTQATFGANSADITNPLTGFATNTLSIFEGEVEDGVERIEVLSTTSTVNILGIENRVIEDRAYIDGVLVEVALDWFAQDTAGNVWYFGEDVINYNYDDEGNLIDTDTEGSWIADGTTSLPGIVMRDAPLTGDSYFQEWAPGVAFDFAEIQGQTASIDIDYGSFTNVLTTGEGNLFDEPDGEVVELKHFAYGTGLILIQEFDDEGEVAYEIPLISQTTVPEPGSAVLLLTASAWLMRHRRPQA